MTASVSVRMALRNRHVRMLHWRDEGLVQVVDGRRKGFSTHLLLSTWLQYEQFDLQGGAAPFSYSNGLSYRLQQ